MAHVQSFGGGSRKKKKKKKNLGLGGYIGGQAEVSSGVGMRADEFEVPAQRQTLGAKVGGKGIGAELDQILKFPTEQAPDLALQTKNASTAYFLKHRRMPNAEQMMGMLLGAPGGVWSVDDWSSVLAPGVSFMENPLLAEFDRVLTGGVTSAGKTVANYPTITKNEMFNTPGSNMEITTAGPNTSGMNFVISDADAVMGHNANHFNLAQFDETRQKLHRLIKVEIEGISPDMYAQYGVTGQSVIAWKQWWASVLLHRNSELPEEERKANPVFFDPNSPKWSSRLDAEYKKWIFSRVAPYAILSRDKKVQDDAAVYLAGLYPEIFGSMVESPLTQQQRMNAELRGDETRPVAIMQLVRLGDVLDAGKMRTDDILGACYRWYTDGRDPGDTDIKTMFDYVSEFGVDALPVSEQKTYQDHTTSFNEILGKPFEFLRHGAESTAELTDFVFDRYKDNPGVIGRIFDTFHTAHHWSIVQLNPMTSDALPYAVTAVEDMATTIFDILQDTIMIDFHEMHRPIMVTGTPEKNKEQKEAYEAMKEGQKAFAEQEHDWSLKSFFSLHALVGQLKENWGKNVLDTMARTNIALGGVNPDSPSSQALLSAAAIGDTYCMFRIAFKGDAYLRAGAKGGALGTWKFMRAGETMLRRALPQVKGVVKSQRGFLDLGMHGFPETHWTKRIGERPTGAVGGTAINYLLKMQAGLSGARTKLHALSDTEIVLDSIEAADISDIMRIAARQNVKLVAMVADADVAGLVRLGFDRIGNSVRGKTPVEYTGRAPSRRGGRLRGSKQHGERDYTRPEAEPLPEEPKPVVPTPEPQAAGPIAVPLNTYKNYLNQKYSNLHGIANAPDGSWEMLRPGHPQYFHVKPLLTVAEWIAFHTKPGDDLDNVISKMLDFDDVPDIVQPVIQKLKSLSDPREVIRYLDDVVRKSEHPAISDIDPLGPAFFRYGKSLNEEAWVKMCNRMGPLGNALYETRRYFTKKVPLERELPYRNAPDNIRELGVLWRMGKKKMSQADYERVRTYEARMSRATGVNERYRVMKDFEKEIRKNLAAEGRLEMWDKVQTTVRLRRYKKYHKLTEDMLAAYANIERRAYGRSGAAVDVSRMENEILKTKTEIAKLRSEGDNKTADIVEQRMKDQIAEARTINEAAKAYFKELKRDPNSTLLKSLSDKLDGLSEEQPVWHHQMRQRMYWNFDPRLFSHFMTGEKAVKFYMWDDKYLSSPVRLWKKFAMFGTGFAFRVYLGDEMWRLPMEDIGIGKFMAGVKEARKQLGMLNRKDKKRLDELQAKDPDALSPAEKTELSALEEKATPNVAEDIRGTVGEDEAKVWDTSKYGSDSFDLVGPSYVDGVATMPRDPGYVPAFKQVISWIGEEPVVKAFFEAEKPAGGWTLASIQDFIRQVACSDTEFGRVMREDLFATRRVPKFYESGAEFRQMLEDGRGAANTHTTIAYRNADAVLSEMADVIYRVHQSPILTRAVKRGKLFDQEFRQLQPEFMWTVPVLREGSLLGQSKLLNFPGSPGWIYDHTTIPLLGYFGQKIRMGIWGSVFKEQRKLMAERFPNASKMELDEFAGQEAAKVIQRATYTRDATVFEDQLRNHLLFVNSYRQFINYWLTKVVTRPLTMSTMWTQLPNIPINSHLGPLNIFWSMFAPFWLQPDWSGEERDKSLPGLIKAVGQLPSLGPVDSPAVTYAIRKATGTQADLSTVPFLETSSLAPLAKFGNWPEALGLFGDDPPQFVKDLLGDPNKTQAQWNALIGQYTDVMPDGSTAVNLPWPFNIWYHLTKGLHNPEAAFKALTGVVSPITVSMTSSIDEQLAAESATYYKLLAEKGPEMARKYLETTERLKIVEQIRNSSDDAEVADLKAANQWVIPILAGKYEYVERGHVTFDQDDVRQAKPLGAYQNQLKQAFADLYGGRVVNDDGSIDPTQYYLGDVNRKDNMERIKKHLEDIQDYAWGVVDEIVKKRGLTGEAAIEFRNKLRHEFKNRTADYVTSDAYGKPVPDCPTWYSRAAERDGKKLRLWHPQWYHDDTFVFMGSDYRSGVYEPSEEQLDAGIRMVNDGLLAPSTAEVLTGHSAVFEQLSRKRQRELIDKYRGQMLDFATGAWYDIDSLSLIRSGIDIPQKIRKPLDDAIMYLRGEYYKFKAVGKKKGTSSREYRNARQEYYAKKDAVFAKFDDVGFLVGSSANRLAKMPWLVGKNYVFQGPDAERDTKIWKEYVRECHKDKPDLEKVKEMRSHFDAHLRDKADAYRAACDWNAVVSTAMYMRYVMKTSYSEYYQGPGNSRYSKMGVAMVNHLYKYIVQMQRSELYRDSNLFDNDMKRYFNNDAKLLASRLLEWYFH